MEILKIYSLYTQQVEKNANTLMGLKDFLYTVTAPLNFHKQVQSRHMGMPTIPSAKNEREHTSYSNKITLTLSEHRNQSLMCFTMKINRIPNNTVPQR